MAGDLSEHFDSSEFRCKCGCGICNVSATLLTKLERLRHQLGRPIHINSGCRCPAYNAKVGGVPDSAHVTTETEACEAADLRVESGHEAFLMIDQIMLYALFTRVGVGKTLLHVDVDAAKPQNVIWIYSDK